MRSLELLEVIDMSRQLVPILFGLLSHEDPKIQSKASLVVQRLDIEFVYTRRLLQHSDARVRANAIQGIANRADPRSLVYLRQGGEDPDHRVRSQAAIGLCRIGDPAGRQILFRMIQHPSAVERRSAAWAMGNCGTFESITLLEMAVRNDPDERVRELAARGIREIQERASESSATGPQ
jgi:HEAT repeat protein